MVIGVRDGDPAYQFSRTRGTRLRSDGGVIVATADGQIRHFDPSGRHVLHEPVRGQIWLRHFVTDASPHVWTVLDGTGQWVADVEMPPGFSVSDIRGDRIAGVSWDEFDVPYVHIYRIHHDVR